MNSMKNSTCSRMYSALVLGAIFMSSTHVQSANKTPENPASAGKFDTESVISSISALNRTRPFPVAEKVAYFVNIKDGDKLKSPFRVAFVVSGMGVAPVQAGKIAGTGHHHILIDMPMPVDIKAPVPFDKPDEYLNQHYKHYGKGETDRKSTRLNSSHIQKSRMPSSA